jgi:hypothetical protein
MEEDISFMPSLLYQVFFLSVSDYIQYTICSGVLSPSAMRLTITITLAHMHTRIQKG